MKSDSIIQVNNYDILDEFYQIYKKNPEELSEDWRIFFRDLEKKQEEGVYRFSYENTRSFNLQDLGVLDIINAYRRQGHLAANIDPLRILKSNRSYIDDKIKHLTKKDLSSIIQTSIEDLKKCSFQKLVDRLEDIYCSKVGCEHYYLIEDEEKEWLQSRTESAWFVKPLDKKIRLRIFEKLFQADNLEKFLSKRYVGKKRFSLEGGETTIPVLDTIVEQTGEQFQDGIVIGMAHRGRLNVLLNIIEKPASLIFAEFDENIDKSQINYGDVKYHLGYSNKKMTLSGKEVSLSLFFNPSHLEAVNPVVMGSVRARQSMKKNFIPVLLHGDASFSGQGVVAETLNLMNLKGYTVKGTFHIVINNQIGFTTLPKEYRSTHYATDLAKGFQIPIFHVNADDPESAYKVATIGMGYKQKFKKDFIMDLVCYRRLGHNEIDEPTFTQPYVYKVIKEHPSTLEIYEKKLMVDGDIEKHELEAIKEKCRNYLESCFRQSKYENIKSEIDTMKGLWSGYSSDSDKEEPETNLLKEKITKIINSLIHLPLSFNPHPKISKLLEARKNMALGKQNIDWGFAEALSFGSILEKGHNIRFSGQDSQRGTFSHRHAVLNDVENFSQYIPLNNISEKQGFFEIINSSLSEYSVLGFEYGYSLTDPNTLVIWEAQFGDFANTAQVLFDQFISSSEYKWKRVSGITVLLPHGYEGQGPEHSSARLERFLRLCADENMQVCNCTTSAQYFHLFRRQILRKFRKPLIIFTPKSLLRYPKSCSSIDNITTGSFQEIIYDENMPKETVEKIIFCSGKVYYDLLEYLENNNIQNTMIVRVEQLYPYPSNQIKKIVTYYEPKKIVWCQEEIKNQGAFFFFKSNFESFITKDFVLEYIGRPESPTPSTGYSRVHIEEQKKLAKDAFEV